MDPSALIASLGAGMSQQYMSLKTRTNEEYNKAQAAKKIAKAQDEYSLSAMIERLEGKRDSRMTEMVSSTLRKGDSQLTQ